MSHNLLIYAPVPLFRANGQLYVESQACVGLQLWADNFAKVDAMMPVIEGAPPEGWVAYESGMIAGVTLHPLPAAYTPLSFFTAYRRTRRQIGALIAQADVLSFAIGGLFGDWGAVGAFEAHKQNRPFAAWTDRVESAVTRLTANEGPLKTRLRKRLSAGPMWALEKAVIRRASLGLFHGRDTFDTYAPFSCNPHVVHDVLLDASYQISEDAFEAKQRAAHTGPLKLVYAGRADTMKGPLEWLQALAHLKQKDVPFEATWLGDGPMLEDMRREAAALDLAQSVHFPGFVNDRATVMATLEAAHVFVFCHKTPESPRCLIEALMAGTPIVGYESAYARDLVAEQGGGRFVALGEPQELGAALLALAKDRSALLLLQQEAFKSGRLYDQDSVFKHRSDVLVSELT